MQLADSINKFDLPKFPVVFLQPILCTSLGGMMFYGPRVRTKKGSTHDFFSFLLTKKAKTKVGYFSIAVNLGLLPLPKA
jgi:hypothetical protein